MKAVPSVPSWRVKLYTMGATGDWDETGTGFTHFSGRVFSCVSETDSLPLESHTVGDEVYKRQGKTILLWSLQEQSYALSFQAEQGAQETIEHICRLQQRDPKEVEDEDLEEESSLPDVVTLKGLSDAVQLFVNSNYQAKQRLADEVVMSRFLTRADSALKIAEEDGDQPALELFFLLYKELVHSCHMQLLEDLTSDSHYEWLLAALEHDPAIAGKRMQFRKFVNSVEFRNVLQTTDARFLELTQRNYRLQYLKDTALARCMDENCLGFLMSIIATMGNEIVGYVLNSLDLRKSLWRRLTSMEFPAYELLKEFCVLAKQSQGYIRSEFFEFLFSEGLMALLPKAFAHDFPAEEAAQVRVILSDALLGLLAVIPSRVRDYFQYSAGPSECGVLVVTVAQALLTAREISSLLQVSELLQALLSPSSEKYFIELLTVFYDSVLGGFIERLKLSSVPDEETRLCVIEILTILTQCVQSHGFRVLSFLRSHDVLSVVLRLLDLKDAPIAIAAVRVMRAVMEKKDSFLTRLIIEENLLQHIWVAFLENGTRENMLFSSIFALIHTAKQTEDTALFEHIVQRHVPLFHNSPLAACFDFFLQKTAAERRRQDPYSLWNPREIRLDEDEEEDVDSLKRKRLQETETTQLSGKKTKLGTGDS